MYQKTCTLLFTILLIISSRQATADVKNLCATEEHTVWSCQAGKKIYSLCASQDLTATNGILQYRAGTNTMIGFRFPEQAAPSKDVFHFDLLPHNVRLSFNNHDYEYDVFEELRSGDTSITVSHAGKPIATVKCDDSTYTLTLTTTENLFTSLGITN